MLATVVAIIVSVAAAGGCSNHSFEPCEDGEGTGLVQLSRLAWSNCNVQVKVPGTRPITMDPIAAIAPICSDGFNKAMADGCVPDPSQMFIINDFHRMAYCAYAGGQAYEKMGCTKSSFFTMVGMSSPIFFEDGKVTDINGKTLFTNFIKTTTSYFSCDSGACKASCPPASASKSISTQYATSEIPTGPVPPDGVSFAWDVSGSYGAIQFSFYKQQPGYGVQTMSLQKVMDGYSSPICGLVVPYGSMETCNSMLKTWSIEGVGQCTSLGDMVYASISQESSIVLR